MNINKITKRFRNPYENNRKYENQKTAWIPGKEIDQSALSKFKDKMMITK